MQNSRLVHILRTFSPKEVRDFRKWITSPVHNLREDVVLLFEYLTTRDRINQEKYLAKKRIFPKIYPNENTYSDAKMRQVIHFLSKTVENFLIYTALLEDEVRAKITLAGVFRKRKLGKSCEKTLRIINDLQKKQPFKNEQFLRNEYILEQETYNYLSGFERKNLNIQEMSDSLDITYFADKLQHACLMLAHQSVMKKEYDKGILEDIMSYVEKNNFLKYSAIAVYYFGYKSITEMENHEHFFKLKNEIETNGNLFPQDELRTIYLMAINYCIRRMNTGKKEFIREAFEMYKTGFEKEILLEQGGITKMAFLNLVIIGTQLKEFIWIEHFINSYQKYLEKHHRENIVIYSFASLFYEKRDYEKAMRYLIQYEIDDVLLNLNSKSMLIKMYYEEEELEPLESLLNSLTVYLKRKKSIGYHKVGYSNFVKLTKKLIRINPFDRNEKSKLKLQIEETNPLTVSNRKWLLDQLNKL